MIYKAAKDMADLLRTGDGGAIRSLNQRIADVNALRGTAAPSIVSFWDFDIPPQPVPGEMPGIYVIGTDAEAEERIQSRRYIDVELEIGCVVGSWDQRKWREHSALIAEALALVLDQVPGRKAFQEFRPSTYRFTLLGWGAPGQPTPLWGGFVANIIARYSDDLSAV